MLASNTEFSSGRRCVCFSVDDSLRARIVSNVILFTYLLDKAATGQSPLTVAVILQRQINAHTTLATTKKGRVESHGEANSERRNNIMMIKKYQKGQTP